MLWNEKRHHEVVPAVVGEAMVLMPLEGEVGLVLPLALMSFEREVAMVAEEVQADSPATERVCATALQKGIFNEEPLNFNRLYITN